MLGAVIICLALVAATLADPTKDVGADSAGSYYVKLISVEPAVDWSSPKLMPDIEINIRDDNEKEILGILAVNDVITDLSGLVNCSVKGAYGWKHNAILYNMKDICNEQVIKEMTTYSDVTVNKDCSVPIGNYTIKGVVLDTIVHKVVGGKLLHGDYLVQFQILSKDEVVFYYVAEISITDPK